MIQGYFTILCTYFRFFILFIAFRGWGPPFVNGESAYFMSANRNKMSMTLNMKSEFSKALIEKMVVNADILIENFLPGKAESLGIGYEELSAINPKLIYCSISGFGSTGIDSQLPGYDAIVSASYGMLHITGEEGGGPVKPGVAITDVLTGVYAHGGILAALYERTKSGRGQKIETSLMEAQLSSLVNIASNYLVTGKDTSKRYGTAHPSIVPYQTFECQDKVSISIAIGNDNQFKEFCKCINRIELANDERFEKNSRRVENRQILLPIIKSEFAKYPCQHWLETFKGKSFPFGPVRTIEESFNTQQARDRNVVVYVDHPKCGRIGVVGPPVKYSRTPSTVRLPPPTLGEHTDHILRNILGFNSEEIETMIKNKVV
jgi:succinate--hydroxymethylglutarate CoA-transferase